MKDCNLKEIYRPVQKIADPLTDLLRKGARDLIRQAVEAELGAMLSEYEDLKLLDGRQALVRNRLFTGKNDSNGPDSPGARHSHTAHPLL